LKDWIVWSKSDEYWSDHMKNKTNVADTIPSMKIEEIDQILLYDLDAIKIEKEDERVRE